MFTSAEAPGKRRRRAVEQVRLRRRAAKPGSFDGRGIAVDRSNPACLPSAAASRGQHRLRQSGNLPKGEHGRVLAKLGSASGCARVEQVLRRRHRPCGKRSRWATDPSGAGGDRRRVSAADRSRWRSALNADATNATRRHLRRQKLQREAVTLWSKRFGDAGDQDRTRRRDGWRRASSSRALQGASQPSARRRSLTPGSGLHSVFVAKLQSSGRTVLLDPRRRRRERSTWLRRRRLGRSSGAPIVVGGRRGRRLGSADRRSPAPAVASDPNHGSVPALNHTSIACSSLRHRALRGVRPVARPPGTNTCCMEEKEPSSGDRATMNDRFPRSESWP